MSFLGKVTYLYGYQKPTKQVIIRVNQKAKNIKYTNKTNLLAKTNSQIGILKKYNCQKLILNYINMLPKEVLNIIKFNNIKHKFEVLELTA